ncbi:MAG: ATP-binding protein, partial [Planctomycetes bacterium]|nr:ATP-binding protein [Planctomycetota bacterium]
TVADQGPAFDPLDRPDPDTTLSVDDRAIGGLGIFLTKQMMDDVSYERRQGKNVLTLVKHCTDATR